jgi:hypothetical protein
MVNRLRFHTPFGCIELKNRITYHENVLQNDRLRKLQETSHVDSFGWIAAVWLGFIAGSIVVINNHSFISGMYMQSYACVMCSSSEVFFQSQHKLARTTPTIPTSE